MLSLYSHVLNKMLSLSYLSVNAVPLPFHFQEHQSSNWKIDYTDNEGSGTVRLALVEWPHTKIVKDQEGVGDLWCSTALSTLESSNSPSCFMLQKSVRVTCKCRPFKPLSFEAGFSTYTLHVCKTEFFHEELCKRYQGSKENFDADLSCIMCSSIASKWTSDETHNNRQGNQKN